MYARLPRFLTVLSLALSLFAALPALAFIPPLGPAIKEMFEERKAAPAFELHSRHRVNVRGAEQFDVEERVLKSGSEYLFMWRFSSSPQWISGSWEFSGRQPSYTVGRDKRFATRSALWVKYFLPVSPEDFANQLLAEQFVRRDQFLQFKPDFTPEGDPQGWDLKQNYLRHPDIFLTRLPQGIAITVVGTEQVEAKRAVYLDKALKGLFRLEWKDAAQYTKWDFESFAKSPIGGFLPRRASFEWEGAQAIATEIHSVRPLNAKQVADFKAQFRNALNTPPLTAPFENALRFLLSYR